jgi:molybdopterin converting factor subunit 1
VKIEVKLFAAARQYAGAESVEVELPEGATPADLRQALVARFPEAQGILRHALFAADMDFVKDDDPLPSEAEIACIPPVSGG